MIKALSYSRLSCCKISYPLIHRLILILLFYLLFKSYINKNIRCWEKLGDDNVVKSSKVGLMSKVTSR